MYDWRPYVSAAERRRNAEREATKLRKKGRNLSPVLIEGRTIARTFWGKAWCENLERYSDYENRLPRGRTYVRNGSVLDLQVAPGEVEALVSGSEVYRVAVKVTAVPPKLWQGICADCAGAIDSLVELLQGRFSKGVMERLCRPKIGLFPAPAEIKFSCSCPDWASMCKHVAAVLYSIGARLDEDPTLLFRLRKVDEADLLARAGTALPLGRKGPAAGRVLEEEGLSDLFGVELGGEAELQPVGAAVKEPARRGRKGTTPKNEAAATARPPAAPARPARKAAQKRAGRAGKPEPKPAKRLRAVPKPDAQPVKKKAKKAAPAGPSPAASPRAPAVLPATTAVSTASEVYELLLRKLARGRREKPGKKGRRR